MKCDAHPGSCMFAVSLLYLIVGQVLTADDGADLRPVGPMIGRVTPYSAEIWARLPVADGTSKCRLLVEDPSDRSLSRWNTTASAEHDWCVSWKVNGLRPDTEYSYRVRQNGDLVFGGEALVFKTPVEQDIEAIVRVGFGSCAESDAGSSRVFSQMLESKCDSVVLLGDTPYIDSTELDVQRRKHREFLRVDGLRRLARCRPVYATWDDHDFGGGNADGSLPGKEVARQAFIEYRGQSPYGDGDGDGGEGIYTSFRQGPLEVFLLDTRYFANTQPGSHTLLGAVQWEWLAANLKQSTAAIKVLACGMVWHDMPEDKPDCWSRYPAERSALFEFIGEHSISGVVLVSGDLHQSRVVEHQTITESGYSIVEFVSSPIHSHTDPASNVPHSGLRKHINRGNVFLQLEVDTQADSGMVTGRYIDKNGAVLHEEILAIALLQKGD
ncbi:MAG: alkaline phosphatase D [Verrucomicrobiales bacterium]|jgi:alkaline phosphatase D